MDSLRYLSEIKQIPIVALKLVEGILAGNYRSIFRGPGLEFDEVREYAEEDDTRFIDWHVTSRMGAPYVKTFREERELILFIAVDQSISMNSGTGKLKRRDVASIVAVLLANAAIRNGDRVGGVLYSGGIDSWIPPMKGRKHLSHVVKEVVHGESEKPGTGMMDAVRAMMESLKRRSVCVIISDFHTTMEWKEISLLKKKHDVLAIRINDPQDRSFPNSGLVFLRDLEDGTVIPSFGRSREFRRGHHNFWANEENDWNRECHRRGVETLTIYTTEDPVVRLMEFFRKRSSR